MLRAGTRVVGAADRTLARVVDVWARGALVAAPLASLLGRAGCPVALAVDVAARALRG